MRQASSSSAIGYFLLSGTSWSRNSSLTACSEIARLTPSSAPQRAIIGTTPAVDSVILRREIASPSGSIDDLQRRGDIVVIVERLAHAHQHDVGELPVILAATAIRRARRARS